MFTSFNTPTYFYTILEKAIFERKTINSLRKPSPFLIPTDMTKMRCWQCPQALQGFMRVAERRVQVSTIVLFVNDGHSFTCIGHGRTGLHVCLSGDKRTHISFPHYLCLRIWCRLVNSKSVIGVLVKSSVISALSTSSPSPSREAEVAPHSAGCSVSAGWLCSPVPPASPDAGGVAAATFSLSSATPRQSPPAAPYSDCSCGSCWRKNQELWKLYQRQGREKRRSLHD